MQSPSEDEQESADVRAAKSLKTYIAATWPPLADVAPAAPMREDYPSYRKYGYALHAHSFIMWR
ncbi:hypothetical protein CCR75_003016 [Bremia lactucae]|uniref:Uncharacterized protein n=1 Tax=Bremia lactucae TaxID=4779 RepID=A0A976IBA7_BRELC|nr:hypothetical protein CCR75_003016 [Bremia lactucae]